MITLPIIVLAALTGVTEGQTVRTEEEEYNSQIEVTFDALSTDNRDVYSGIYLPYYELNSLTVRSAWKKSESEIYLYSEEDIILTNQHYLRIGPSLSQSFFNSNVVNGVASVWKDAEDNSVDIMFRNASPGSPTITGLYLTDAKDNCPDGYTLTPVDAKSSLNGDLNQDSIIGKDIYLCQETGGSSHVSNLYLTEDEDNCPDGYTLTPMDSSLNGNLNQGAIGADIFLCQSFRDTCIEITEHEDPMYVGRYVSEPAAEGERAPTFSRTYNSTLTLKLYLDVPDGYPGICTWHLAHTDRGKPGYGYINSGGHYQMEEEKCLHSKGGELLPFEENSWSKDLNTKFNVILSRCSGYKWW